MSEKFLKKFRDINIFVVYFKIAAGVTLLAVFGPICLFNGLYGGALLTAVLSIILSFFIFKRAILHISVETQHTIAKILFIENLAIAIASVYLIFFAPLDGNWTPLAGTENWSDPALVHIDSNKYAVFCTHDGTRKLFYTENSGTSWEDCQYKDGFGWEIEYHKGRNELWIGPMDDSVIHRFNLTVKEWDTIVRIPGKMKRFTLSENKGYLTTRNRLYIYDLKKNEWNLFRFTDSYIEEAVQSGGDNSLILTVGKYWFQSKDNGRQWDDVKPRDSKMANPRVAIGGGGWRYVYEGGLLSGTLYGGAPGEHFEKRQLPASDVRVLVANPENGREVWIGSWGQGIFQSTDGGQTWQYRGLRKIQVRTMAVDFDKQEVLVGSSNPIFDKGIYKSEY